MGLVHHLLDAACHIITIIVEHIVVVDRGAVLCGECKSSHTCATYVLIKSYAVNLIGVPEISPKYHIYTRSSEG